MTKVAINVTPNETKAHHKRGNYYLIDGELYILSQVDDKHMVLTALNDGNRYYDPVYVKDIFNVTEAEFGKMCGKSYEFIDEILIKRNSPLM